MRAELIGYSAIIFSLLAMSQTSVWKLRVLHMISAVIYILYGSMLDAYPIVFGSCLFLLIHSWHLIKLKSSSS
ncbi:MAG: hypothetical protein CMB80_31950 [Flammeovirgaceae bacterium]|nr:hypothetical protein [Flammeovirgaceae bacterium]MBR09010.1 hypothetical protein [Rickettsiales bacterium]HCX23349.1 hypothetical protein [Cytophagales bacterium]